MGYPGRVWHCPPFMLNHSIGWPNIYLGSYGFAPDKPKMQHSMQGQMKLSEDEGYTPAFDA